MNKRERSPSFRGSGLWPIAYAVSSIRKNASKSIGIAVILGLGLSLIPAVMTWTSTGIRIEVNEFVDETVYQLGMKPINYEEANGYDLLLAAEQLYSSHPWVKSIDRILSTVCIVDGPPEAAEVYPLNQDLYYTQGYKDARIILADSNTLERWKPLFNWRGDFRIGTNQVVVSEVFIDYLEIATGRRVQIGDVIDIEIVLGAHGPFPNMRGNRGHSLQNLTIVGVYELSSGTSVFSNAFISMSRKLVDPFAYPQPVLGVSDSVIVNLDDIPDEVVEEVTTRSFFSVSSLIQANADGLLAMGESEIPYHLQSLIEFIGEPEGLDAWGILEVEKLEYHINTYQQSRILAVLSLPVLFVSLIIMVNAAESSVMKRRNEASLLRTKGASYNQILSSYIWESILLFAISWLIGISLSLPFASLIGATTGILALNYTTYLLFSNMQVINALGFVLATVVGLSLPIAYLLQIGRLIETDELIALREEVQNEVEQSSSLLRTGLLICIILIVIVILPYIILPIGFAGIGELLILTVALYVTSFLGARFAKQMLASATAGLSFLIGEKSIYISRSLSKRKGRLLPLIVILTLIITSTNMMIVELNSFHRNLESEIDYAIGADMRIERENASLELADSFRHIAGIIETTPVVEFEAQIGNNQFYLEGVEAAAYSRIAHFRENSFISNTTQNILAKLDEVPNGIILSEYHGNLWNKSIGDSIEITYFRPLIAITEFTIIGFMNSAPGFGVASTKDLTYPSISSGFGFQVGRGGFALTNFEFLRRAVNVSNVELFFASVISGTNMQILSTALSSNFDATVYAPGFSNPRDISRSVNLFLSGFESLISLSVVILAVMGVFAIISLLSSAVAERSQEYAVLRAVGATKKQVVSMVFQEFASVLFSVITISMVLGIALGTTLGLLAMGISPIWSTLHYTPDFSILHLILISLMETVVLSVACYIPARWSTKYNLSEMLRNL